MGILHERETLDRLTDIEPNLLLAQDLAIDHLTRIIQVVRTTTGIDRTSLSMKRYCYGCGSLDHILSGRKCTPTLQLIRMNLVAIGNHGKRMEKELAIQFMTLYPTSSKDSEFKRVEAALSTDFIAPRRSEDEKAEVQFQESLYHQFEEWDTIQSYIEVATHGKIFDIHYATTLNPHIIDFDTSNTHLTNTANTALTTTLDFGSISVLRDQLLEVGRLARC